MIDSDLLRHVRGACRMLALNSGSLADRLSQAANEFSVSLIQPDLWPSDLLEAAQALDNDLRAGGDYTSTIAALPEQPVQDLAQRLLDLSVDVQVAVKLDMRENV